MLLVLLYLETNTHTNAHRNDTINNRYCDRFREIGFDSVIFKLRQNLPPLKNTCLKVTT